MTAPRPLVLIVCVGFGGLAATIARHARLVTGDVPSDAYGLPHHKPAEEE